MKQSMIHFAAIGAAIGIVVASPAQAKPVTNSVVDALVKANAAWLAAINAGSNDRALMMMTPNAAIIQSVGEQAIGDVELKRRVGNLAKLLNFHIDYKFSVASLADDGKVGFVLGDSKISYDLPDGAKSSSTQRLLTVWRLDRHGRWKCYLDVVL